MRRRGFTKIELAIAVAIVAILIAVLLPGIARVNERAARTQTNNNLKDCALAIHNYHDAYRRLPNAYGPGPNFEAKPVSMWFQLLPYLEQTDAYKAERFDALIPAFVAPIDSSPANREGAVNFAANLRVFAYRTITPAKANRVDALDVPHGELIADLTLARIIDGTANTIMMTTRYANCNGQTTWYASDAYGNCSLGKLPSPGFGGFMGAGSYTSPPTSTGPITAIYQLNPTVAECLPQVGVFGHSFGLQGISSALFDASVKNISPTMAPRTFASAISPGDQNPPGVDIHD